MKPGTVVVMLVVSRGMLLLVHRNNQDPTNPGTAALPSAIVKKGLTPEKAAREGLADLFGSEFANHIRTFYHELGASPDGHVYFLVTTSRTVFPRLQEGGKTFGGTRHVGFGYRTLDDIKAELDNGQTGGPNQLAGVLTTFVRDNWEGFADVMATQIPDYMTPGVLHYDYPAVNRGE